MAVDESNAAGVAPPVELAVHDAAAVPDHPR